MCVCVCVCVCELYAIKGRGGDQGTRCELYQIIAVNVWQDTCSVNINMGCCQSTAAVPPTSRPADKSHAPVSTPSPASNTVAKKSAPDAKVMPDAADNKLCNLMPHSHAAESAIKLMPHHFLLADSTPLPQAVSFASAAISAATSTKSSEDPSERSASEFLTPPPPSASPSAALSESSYVDVQQQLYEGSSPAEASIKLDVEVVPQRSRSRTSRAAAQLKQRTQSSLTQRLSHVNVLKASGVDPSHARVIKRKESHLIRQSSIGASLSPAADETSQPQCDGGPTSNDLDRFVGTWKGGELRGRDEFLKAMELPWLVRKVAAMYARSSQTPV